MGERRRARRTELKSACTLSLDGREVPALMVNLSDQGVLVRFAPGDDPAVTDSDLGTDATLILSTVTPHRHYTGEIIRLYFAENALHVVLRFWKNDREIH